MSGRFQSNKLWATYPQCDLEKEDALKLFMKKWGVNLKYALIARERHEDGNWHLHAYIEFHTRLRERRMDFADIQGHHGHYEPAKKPDKVIAYCKKEDPSPLEYGAMSGLKRKIGAEIAKTILTGKGTLSSLTMNEEYASFLMLNLQKVRKWEDHCKILTWSPDSSIVPNMNPNRLESRIMRWIAMNVGSPRKIRQPQLYLHGKPQTGKTTLVACLSKIFRTYFPMTTSSNGSTFFDGYTNHHDLVVFDEFAGQYELTFMNDFLSNGPMTLNIKGSTLEKTNMPACILLSNFPPSALITRS